MVPRTEHRDFDVQFQINQEKELAQILHLNAQDFKTKSIRLKKGYEHTIEISLNGRTTTNGFETLSLTQRGCRLDHETHENSIFKIYSQANCQYECQVSEAIQACKCLPWDFLHYEKYAPECDIFGRTCFFQTIERVKHDKTIHCPHCIQECNQVTFKASITKSVPLRLENIGKKVYCDKQMYLCGHEL